MSPVYGLIAPLPPCSFSKRASSALIWATMVSLPRPRFSSSSARRARSLSLKVLKSIRFDFFFILASLGIWRCEENSLMTSGQQDLRLQ